MNKICFTVLFFAANWMDKLCVFSLSSSLKIIYFVSTKARCRFPVDWMC